MTGVVATLTMDMTQLAIPPVTYSTPLRSTATPDSIRGIVAGDGEPSVSDSVVTAPPSVTRRTEGMPSTVKMAPDTLSYAMPVMKPNVAAVPCPSAPP